MSNIKNVKKIIDRGHDMNPREKSWTFWAIAVILLAILREVKEMNDYSGGTPAGPGL